MRDKYKNDVSYTGSPEQLEEYAKKLEEGGMIHDGYIDPGNFILTYKDGMYGFFPDKGLIHSRVHFQSHQMNEALAAALELAEPEVKKTEVDHWNEILIED